MNGETIFLLSIFFQQIFAFRPWLNINEKLLWRRWLGLRTNTSWSMKFTFDPYTCFFVCISLSLLYPKIDFSWLCHLDTEEYHNVFLNKVNMLFKYRPFDNILLYSSIKKSMFYSPFYLFCSCPFHFSIRIILCNLN